MKCTAKGPFAGMVHCSRCGKTYIKKQRNPGKINMLVCGNKRTDEGCTSEYVYYEAFAELIKTCINDIVINKHEFLNKLEYQISTKIAESENDERITLVDSQIDEYEKKLKQLLIIDEIYGQKTIIDLKDKIANLKLERANLTNNYYLNKNCQKKHDKVKEFLNEIKEPIKSINDIDFKSLISNIKVIERDQFIFFIDCFNKKSNKNDSNPGQALWSGNYVYQIRRLNFNMRYSIFLD
jgi:hypothetical protein